MSRDVELDPGSIYDHRDRDQPFNEAASVTLGDGNAAVTTLSPSDRQSRYFLRMAAATKIAGTTYRVEVDGETIFSDSAVPPTDIDDAVDTFTPPKPFEEDVVMTITNATGSQETYRMQFVGWERRLRGTESEEVPWL